MSKCDCNGWGIKCELCHPGAEHSVVSFYDVPGHKKTKPHFKFIEHDCNCDCGGCSGGVYVNTVPIRKTS